MNNYEIEAKKFLTENKITFSVKYVGETIPMWDGKEHSEFKCRFFNRKNKKSMTVHFFQSIDSADKIPSCYDVLACLTKYDIGTIDDFVNEFGYEINSWQDVKRIDKTYKACKREYKSILRVFSDCLEDLQEIN